MTKYVQKEERKVVSYLRKMNTMNMTTHGSRNINQMVTIPKNFQKKKHKLGGAEN